MEPAGSALFAIVDGTVSARHYGAGGQYYYEVAITDGYGFTWQYHHVNETTVSQDVLDAIANGTTILPGTYIGNIVTWPTAGFHHLHLNCVHPGGNLVNPLNLLLASADSTPPEIYGVYVTANQGDTALNAPGSPVPAVCGLVDVVCDSGDRDDFGQYLLTMREVRYRIKQLSADQSHHVAPALLWNFDVIPGGSNINAYVWDVFRQTLHVGADTYTTQGNYSQRRFLYVPTNATGSLPADAAGCWDTTAFPDGTYRIYVTVSDENGNDAARTLDVVVDNP
jgi:hypothetical protein